MIGRRYNYLILLALILILNGSDADASEIPKRAGRSKITLESCISQTLKNSFEVKIAVLDYMIAETDFEEAVSVYDTFLSGVIGYDDDRRRQLSVFSPSRSKTNTYSVGASKKLPTGTELTVEFGDVRTWDNSSFVSTNPAHTAELEFSLKQPIAKNAFGYIDRRNVNVAKLAVKNADMDRKDRIETIISETSELYWTWVFAGENLRIYIELEEEAENLYENNKKNYEIGRIEKGDLLASKVNYISRGKDVLTAQSRLKNAEDDLKRAMNIDGDISLSTEEKLNHDNNAGISLSSALKYAFLNRRDYKKALEDINIKKMTLETKKNEQLPVIDVVATMAANGVNSNLREMGQDFEKHKNSHYYAGVEISLPVENRAASSQADKAVREKEKAILTAKAVERDIITEIGNAFRDLDTSRLKLNNLTEISKLQKEKLDEELKRFKYGRSSTKAIIDYQRDYLLARLDYSAGMLDVILSDIRLKRAMNGLLENYEELL